MKKITIFLLFLALVSARPLLAVEADSSSAGLGADSDAVATVPPPATEHRTVSSPEKLLNLDSSRAASRITDLERRVDDLERQMRYQEDHIRTLEREIEDLRRRS